MLLSRLTNEVQTVLPLVVNIEKTNYLYDFQFVLHGIKNIKGRHKEIIGNSVKEISKMLKTGIM